VEFGSFFFLGVFGSWWVLFLFLVRVEQLCASGMVLWRTLKSALVRSRPQEPLV
jgi:hypothetical protein